MASNLDITLRQHAPLAGLHRDLMPVALDQEHRFGRIAVKLAMQPTDEFHRGGLGQPVFAVHPIYLGLHANMRRRLKLKVAALLIVGKLAFERAFDVARARDMPFEQVAVIGVHDPHETGEIGGGARVQGRPQRGRRRRKLGNQVGDRLRRFLEARGLNSLGDLFPRHFWPIS